MLSPSMTMNCVQLKHLSSAIRSISNHRPVSKTTINLSVLKTSPHQCRDFKEFKRILSQMILTGFIKDTFAAKRLLQVSTHDLRFIHLDYSYKIFNVIENPDASIYNIMMMAYVRRNYPHRAIHFYKLMLYRNVGPNVYTYPFLVEACAIRKSKFEGKQMHNHVLKLGFEFLKLGFEGKQMHNHVLKLGFDSDVYVRSTFVDMYACYDIDDAFKVFNEGPMMDSFVWYSLLEGCDIAVGFGEVEYIYNLMPEKEKDTVALNGLVAHFLSKAEQLMNAIPKNDTVSWSELINCYQTEPREMYEEALDLFIWMHGNGIRIDELVVEAALLVCINIVGFRGYENIQMTGKLIHSLVVKIGIESDVELQNSLIVMYAKCGQILSAQKLFNAACWLDESSWYHMLQRYVEWGLDENVKALFESMPQKDPWPCSVMISYYSQRDCFSESLALFQKMVRSGIRLDTETLYDIIRDLPTSFAALDLGKCIHAYLIKKSYSLKDRDRLLKGALESMYGKSLYLYKKSDGGFD